MRHIITNYLESIWHYFTLSTYKSNTPFSFLINVFGVQIPNLKPIFFRPALENRDNPKKNPDYQGFPVSDEKKNELKKLVSKVKKKNFINALSIRKISYI